MRKSMDGPVAGRITLSDVEYASENHIQSARILWTSPDMQVRSSSDEE